jgi:putative ABC transport system permease protein
VTILMRLALLLCPREFRAEYGEQISSDAEGGAGVACAFDLARTGLTLRAEAVTGDIAIAFRSLSKAKLLTAVSVSTLALAIGANAAVFGIIRSVVLAPLPYNDASQLVFLCQNSECANQMPNPTVGAIGLHARTLSGAAAFQWAGATMIGHGLPRALQVAWSSWNVFQVLGATPRLGRFLTRADASVNVASVVISERLWRKAFDSDPTIVGRSIVLDGRSRQVVGVAPDGFTMPVPYSEIGTTYVDAWIAMPEKTFFPTRNPLGSWAFARMKPGVAVGEVQADLDRIAPELQRTYPASFLSNVKTVRISAYPIAKWFFREVNVLLAIALAAVLLVLVIACANVGNLLLARSLARSGEFALRGAIGARAGRVATQVLTEAALLAAAGGVVGLALAWLGLRAIVHFMPYALPRLEDADVDARVLLFTLGIAVIATLAAGAFPAFAASRRDLASALRAGGRDAGESSTRAVRSILASVEIGLAFAVMVASLLLVRTFIAASSEPQGYDPIRVHATELSLSGTRYRSMPARVSLMQRVVGQLSGIPSVQSAAFSRNPPDSGSGADGDAIRIPGRTFPTAAAPTADYASVTPRYFSTLGIPLLRGREFGDRDRSGSAVVAIVNQAFALRYFGGAAIGQRLGIDGISGPETVSIVGVVGDVRPFPGSPMEDKIYLPYAQYPSDYGLPIVKLRSDDPAIGKEVARAIAAADPLQAAGATWSYEAVLANGLDRRRASALLLSLLALLALGLALAGIYAVNALSVEARSREFGLRMAVGARERDVTRMVLRHTLLLAVAGIGGGAILVACASRAFETLLYGVSPLDPFSIALAVTLFLGCAIAAAAAPASRAARINPAVALRAE